MEVRSWRRPCSTSESGFFSKSASEENGRVLLIFFPSPGNFKVLLFWGFVVVGCWLWVVVAGGCCCCRRRRRRSDNSVVLLKEHPATDRRD